MQLLPLRIAVLLLALQHLGREVLGLRVKLRITPQLTGLIILRFKNSLHPRTHIIVVVEVVITQIIVNLPMNLLHFLLMVLIFFLSHFVLFAIF